VSVTLDAIESASRRLEGKVVRTPLLMNRQLDELTGATVVIKPENLQHIGAFKFRGAYNRLCQFDEGQRKKGAVAFSSGNHAQGVALAARLIGMQATIVMPTDAPAIKLARTRDLGATVRLYDRETESREEIAASIAESIGATLVPAFDDADVIAGQGTCGLEIAQQLRDHGLAVDDLLCPVGGGGLMAGVSTALRALQPRITIWGVEPQDYDDHARSKLSGNRERIHPARRSICDALLASMPGELTWSVNSRTVDNFVAVTDVEVTAAISFAFHALKVVIEPGGAVGLAYLLHNREQFRGRRVCVVVSGGNIDPDLFAACLTGHTAGGAA
jgi:threonine dehydratase